MRRAASGAIRASGVVTRKESDVQAIKISTPLPIVAICESLQCSAMNAPSDI